MERDRMTAPVITEPGCQHLDDEQIISIQLQLNEIKETLAFIKETIVKADGTITKIADEVQPTLDGLLKSPLVKMLMPKGK
jgi:hypothetical protein